MVERERVQAVLKARAEREQAIIEARKQPKSPEEEKALATKYGGIDDLGERAFAILTDLGIVSSTPDPSSSDYDASHDDEIAA